MSCGLVTEYGAWAMRCNGKIAGTTVSLRVPTGLVLITADRSLVPLTVVLKLGPCVSKTQRIVTCITADSR
jgi:hypothetical protein